MEKTLVLDFKELRYIVIECSKCRVKITFDMSQSNSRIPGACPSCGQPFDLVSVQTPLASFREIYRMLTSLEHRITVQVPLEKSSDG